MRHFKSIIEQPTPPSINDIWLSGNIMRYFTNGKWTTIGEQDIPEVQSYELPTATTSRLGGVKKASGVELLASDADLPAVVSKVNEIITKLKSAGLIA